jgi:fatty-acyl-CoA synthase
MPFARDFPIRNLQDVKRFESEKTFAERCPAQSVYDIFRHAAERFPSHTALTMLMTGVPDEKPRIVSYTELLAGITRAANFFADIGGSRPGIAFMLPSLIETQFVLWGAETAGYALPINFLLQPEHIAHLIQAADVHILVALGPHPQLDIWEKAVTVAELVPGLKLVQISLSDAPPPEGVQSFIPSLSKYDGQRLTFGAPGSNNEVAAYFHTGGTTGAPKLVTHTHRNQITAAFGGTVLYDFSDKDVMTNGLPLFHVAGTILCGLSMFLAGVHLVIMSPGGMRNPAMIQNFWKIIEQYRVTIGGGVPTVMAALLSVPVGDADISSLRFSISGAAAAPKTIVEQYEAKTGRRVHECLGMTECGGLISISPPAGDRVIGSVGYRLPYIETAVRKLNADGSLGAECAPREIGVLTISGPNVTPGYRDRKDNDGLIVDGVLNGGDLAYTDETGRIFIAGRAKDIIIRSGHNIDPQAIEDAVVGHPAVIAAAAVGQPDKYAGELPVCYVALKPGASVTADELRTFAEPRIAERPAWPKSYFIVDTIPVTGVGKIFKPPLRSDAARRLIETVVTEVTGTLEVTVSVAQGGKRGSEAVVTLPAHLSKHVLEVEAALSGYLFDYKVVLPPA